jgi:hypothetical protein
MGCRSDVPILCMPLLKNGLRGFLDFRRVCCNFYWLLIRLDRKGLPVVNYRRTEFWMSTERMIWWTKEVVEWVGQKRRRNSRKQSSSEDDREELRRP